MKVTVAKLKRYLIIFLHLLSFKLKALMEYRLNFFIQLFYGPAYVLVLFLILQTAYSKTPTLGGWNREEATLLFSVLHLQYSLAIMTFISGYRHFLWEGLRKGEVDFVLTKPLPPQFLIAFSRPELQQVPLLIGVALLFVRQVLLLHSVFTPTQVGVFLVMVMISMLILFFTVGCYGAIGFFVTRGQQLMEFFDKMSDFSQYPMPIFPTSLKFIAFTVVPIAFFSFVPTSFLLGRGSWWLFGLSLLVLGGAYVANRVLWREGLKRYSSASS